MIQELAETSVVRIVRVNDELRTSYGTHSYRVIKVKHFRDGRMNLTCVFTSFPHDQEPGANHRFWLNDYLSKPEADGSYRHSGRDDRLFLQPPSNQTNHMKTLEAAPPRGKKTTAAALRKTTATATAATSAPQHHLRNSDESNGLQTPGQGYQVIAPQKLWRSATNRTVEKDEEYVKLRENIRAHGILQPLVVRALPEGEWFVEPGTLSKAPGFFVNCRAYAKYVCRPLDQQNVSHPIWSQWVPPFFKDKAEAEANLPQFEIIIGEHRWTAALEIGLAEVPIIVRPMDDRTAILTQLSENLRRKSLKPLDEARGYQRMMDLGMKVEDIGKELGSADKELSKSTIYARLKLLKLPATAMEAVESGMIPASHAELITKLETPEAQAALTAQILKPKEVYSGGGYQKEMISFREAKELADTAAKEEAKEKAWQVSTKQYGAPAYKVFTLKQSEGVFQYGRLRQKNYVAVSDKCDLDPQGRTWKALLGKHEPTPIVAHNSYDTKKVWIVYARKAAEKGLKAAGHDGLVDAGAPKGESAEAKRQREEEKRKQEREIKRAIASANIAKVVAAAEAREPNADFFRLLIDAIVDDQGIEEAVLERRKIAVLEKDSWQKDRIAVKRYAEKADGKTLRGLLLECLLTGWDGANEELLQTAAKLYKVKLQTSGKKKGGADAEEDDEA